ncbi:hypothetical protein [Spongiactinospora sp. TRM90649]|uniref:hypothetical protein n=1 Tax=Spongiactinospora sp. TRM90649 TaxID=3031114 RepID=UPI0023F8533D|nr:hypothetical protein [Spongiactinospora sp. TRM90649]MDF5751627.1 hypothetical protein [Spongiactinospora sp. TRM90649]
MRRAVLALPLLLAACGTAPASTAARATAPPAQTRYTATGTVLANAEHGPTFCNGVMQSLPPQCTGAPVVGWDWKAGPHESQAGTRWGDFTVVGTWDGTSLHLTEPAKPAPSTSGTAASDRLPDSPCPAPEGGWRPVRPADATEEARAAALTAAKRSPRFAGAWIDNHAPGLEMPKDDRDRRPPIKSVLNVMFTGDLAEGERTVRALWGGPLCVYRAEHTEAELEALQRRAGDEIPGVLSTSVDTFTRRVNITVYVVTGALRRDLDRRYGPGRVEPHGVFQPVS